MQKAGICSPPFTPVFVIFRICLPGSFYIRSRSQTIWIRSGWFSRFFRFSRVFLYESQFRTARICPLWLSLRDLPTIESDRYADSAPSAEPRRPVHKHGKQEDPQIDHEALLPLGAPVKPIGDRSAKEGLGHVHGQADPSQVRKDRVPEYARMGQDALAAEDDGDRSGQQAEDDQGIAALHGAAHIGDGQGKAGQGCQREDPAADQQTQVRLPARKPGTDPAADLKGSGTDGDLRESPDIGLIGDEEPVVDIPQPPGQYHDGSQQGKAQHRACKAGIKPVKPPAQGVGQDQADQHRADVPGTADEGLPQPGPLQEEERRHPQGKIFQCQGTVRGQTDKRRQGTGCQIKWQDGTGLVCHELEGLLRQRFDLPDLPFQNLT